MSAETIVIWQDECLPIRSSTIVQSEGAQPTSLFFLECKYEHADGRKLKGRTVSGDCLSVNASVAFCVAKHSTIHNFDSANGVPIANPEEIEEFESYITKLVIENAFVGDRFIEQSNPSVDELVFESRDLQFLCKMVFFEDEECFSVTLFENECVSVQYCRAACESTNLLHKGIDFTYSVRFVFKTERPLEEAERIWVKPIINLLMVVLGGDIVPDDMIIYSKTLGAKFRRFGSLGNSRMPQFEPSISRLFFQFDDVREELSRAIGAWMERPNTLHGASVLYPHARYRDVLAEVSFSFAMRMAESAYADRILADVFETCGAPRSPSGVIDLRENKMKDIRKKLKELSNPREHSFAAKIRSLGERFDCVFRDCGFRVDWEACAEDCKDIRNAEAHGTLVGGQPQGEYDKMFALEQMGLLFYELAVLDLFLLDEIELREARIRLFKRRQYNITVADFWPLLPY